MSKTNYGSPRRTPNTNSIIHNKTFRFRRNNKNIRTFLPRLAYTLMKSCNSVSVMNSITSIQLLNSFVFLLMGVFWASLTMSLMNLQVSISLANCVIIIHRCLNSDFLFLIYCLKFSFGQVFAICLSFTY